MFPKNPQKVRSIRTRFAYKFLGALKKLNGERTSTSSSSSSVQSYRRRCQMVKMAAYASMASAVGSRRAWSRALLWKIRNRGLRQRAKRARALIRKRISISSSSAAEENPSKGFNLDELRKLVPGGEVMDLLSLFDETAHYIKCLTFQPAMKLYDLDFLCGKERFLHQGLEDA